MRVKFYLKCVPAILRHPGILVQKRQYLFLISHMRSYSSLLGHILGSHPDISGYTEAHLQYTGPFSLLQLRLHVLTSHGYRLKGHCLFDKILHNYVITDAILARPDVRLLFSLRSPEATLKSIIANERAKALPAAYSGEPEEVVKEYIKRLHGIRRCADKAGKNAAYFDADRLVDDGDRLLAGLSEWLCLTPVLRSQYDTFALTGMHRFGDSSVNIRQGEIRRHGDTREEIVIPAPLLQDANTAYHECRTHLAERLLVL